MDGKTVRKCWKIGAVVLVLVWAILFIRFRKRAVDTAAGSPQSVPASVTRQHIDPAPEISLQINHADGLTLYRGTPMVLNVRVVNHQAMIADAQETSDRVYIQQLRAAAKRSEISKERVEATIARVQLAPEVSAINLGEDDAPWDSFLQLSQQLPDGTLRPLGWTTKVIRPPAAKRLALTTQTEAELTFAVEPSSATQIPLGEYVIVAALNIPAKVGFTPGTWTGLAESDPVKLTIADKPGRLSPDDEERLDLQFADYFYAGGDFAEAAKRAQSALAVNPKSISAEIAIGEARKAQGDLKGALEVFQKARSEYYRQYPKSYEPPTLLLSRISDIEAAMESEQPPAGSPP
jgi:tetratricopeptide (TPR) repeat protein